MLAGRFEMHKYIGGGSFGQIFSAVDRKNNKVVAIKAESNKVKSPKLLLEFTVYDKYLRGCVGFPEVSHFSRSRNHQFFVMTLLGKNIEELFKKCDSVFSMKTVLMLTDQIIQRLQVSIILQKCGKLRLIRMICVFFRRCTTRVGICTATSSRRT